MKRSDLTIPAIIIDTVTAVCLLVYIALQVFYGLYYHVSPSGYLLNVAIVLLIFGALSYLLTIPEVLNHLAPDQCVGKIREYSLGLLRMARFIFLAGLLIPCVCDALNIGIRSSYSGIVVLLLIAVVLYYESKIINELRNSDDHKDED